uniref:Uncharacterized protein n=1 Tax=Meloidogyne enterolobii TaxID=390850 RepID=A0A6V7XSY4_MELEN|nr:unnamed protein product [Meloidogyne enterolobii]
MKVILAFISMVAILGVNTAQNDTATTTSTATNITKPTSTVDNPPPSPPPTNGTDPVPLESHSTTNKVDGANTKNISECPITTRLYDNIGEQGDGKNKKNCTEPGCFFIYEQKNLGWDFPSFLIGNKRRGVLLYLTGCIYDIPHLLERTKGKGRINQALRAVRACYIGKRRDAGKSQHCQPEYEGEGQISFNQGMDPITRKDKLRDTWAGRFLPSTQNRCFVEFLNGIFYVNDDGKGIIVCCTGGHTSQKDVSSFKSSCHDVTKGIDDLAWRAKIDN